MINRRSSRAQAMVEFALALPVFLMVLYGLIEASRLIFIVTTVSNASREAVRYASAWGMNAAGYPQYQDCPGIRTVAKRVGFLLNLQDSNITIQYDHGLNPIVPTPPAIPNCTSSPAQTNVIIDHPGVDRVLVTVRYTYRPILVNFLPFTTIISSPQTARTIMGQVDMNKP